MELTTEATITKAGIKSETANYAREAATVLELSFSLRLPKPQPALSIEAWAAEYGANGGQSHVSTYNREQAAKAASEAKKAAKGKKKDTKPTVEPCEWCKATFKTEEEADDHVSECDAKCATCGEHPEECQCPAPVDQALADYLKPFYDDYVAEKRAHNRDAMLASQHAAMFISLINTPVKISLSPVQEGMLFALGEGGDE